MTAIADLCREIATTERDKRLTRANTTHPQLGTRYQHNNVPETHKTAFKKHREAKG